MVLRLKTFFEQIEEEILENAEVVEFMNDGNVVEVGETDEYFSIFDYNPHIAPIWAEFIGGGCTWIVTKEEPSNDYWVFKVHKIEHCDYDDPNYYEDNKYDCRNCPNFYLLNGNYFYCNGCGRNISELLMDECYAEGKLKKDVK